MVTRLRNELRREISIGGAAYVVTIDDSGLRLTEKGRRKGYELRWKDLLDGQAALAAALYASEERLPASRPRARRQPAIRRRPRRH